MGAIRILVADDHPIVRAGIRAILSGERDLQVAGDVGRGEAIASAVSATSPDVLILDLNMPGLTDPAALTHHLRQAHPHLRILVLTAHDDEELILSLLEAGATGYALKDEMEAKLVEAVRQVAQGSPWVTQKVAQVMLARLVRTGRGSVVAKPSQSPNPHTLPTARELEVLTLIASGASNAEIALRLSISERTVRAHATNIYTKLGLRRRTDAVAYAIRHRLVPS